MKGIKNYFKPASEIVAKETNVGTNIIAKETNMEQSQSSVAKGTSLVAEKPCQPSSSFSIPKTAFGKQNRSCQFRCFIEFSWLDYDEVNDSVTCFICKKTFEKPRNGEKQRRSIPKYWFS